MYAWLRERLAAFSTRPARPALDEGDAMLITYGDQFLANGELPLHTLARFAGRYLQDGIRSIHILPFYPSTSDDGFAVADYCQVDPALGGWEQVRALGDRYDLMFDAVINHVSAGSAWFLAFRQGDAAYRDYFIDLPPDTPLAQVVRPRTTPLLTPFDTPRGRRWVWTTFSADQVDLNYANPRVLHEMIDVLLFYVRQGARFIRLDAIAYLWKEAGTSCIHLPQTHAVVQLFRAILDEAAPGVLLITETNVPHRDNLSYFGDGANEAHLVYNFALPPLVLHTFATGEAAALSRWADGLRLPSGQVTFFNFLASHDGVGLNPVRGILSGEQIDALVQRCLDHGGLVSSKTNADGSTSPYELNISYFDALSDPAGDEPPALQVQRFLAAQAILLALVGLPGIYVHSLLGSRSWQAGLHLTGRSRTINREKLDFSRLVAELEDPRSLRAQVYRGYLRLLRARAGCPAFHPHGSQQVLDVHPGVFALQRTAPDGQSRALCLHNVTDQEQEFPLAHCIPPGTDWLDLLRDRPADLSRGIVRLEPYQVYWLRQAS
ncbi:MAG: sugar phosphorylase [Chloroflexi bacterium]|nr:sugar phosphorylase [Anaerolineaceae bacterium]NMB89498.1 sugar phosphorylase [Chloroflexota bacterium]